MAVAQDGLHEAAVGVPQHQRGRVADPGSRVGVVAVEAVCDVAEFGSGEDRRLG